MDVMKPYPGSLAVNDVTTSDHRDVRGRQSIHQDRPIGVVEGRALCCGEQLRWHRTSLYECLQVPSRVYQMSISDGMEDLA